MSKEVSSKALEKENQLKMIKEEREEMKKENDRLHESNEVLRAQIHARETLDLVAREEQNELNVLRSFHSSVMKKSKIIVANTSVSVDKSDEHDDAKSGRSAVVEKEECSSYEANDDEHYVLSFLNRVDREMNALRQRVSASDETHEKLELEREQARVNWEEKTLVLEQEKQMILEEKKQVELDCRQLKKQLQEAKEENEKLKSESIQQKSENSSLKACLGREKEIRDEQQEQSRAARSNLESIVARKQRDEEDYVHLKLSHTQIKERADNLELSLNDAMKQIETLKTENATIEKEFIRVTSVSESSRRQNEQLQIRLQAALEEMQLGLEFAALKEKNILRALETFDIKIATADSSIQSFIDDNDVTKQFAHRIDFIEASLCNVDSKCIEFETEIHNTSKVAFSFDDHNVDHLQMMVQKELSASLTDQFEEEKGILNTAIVERDASISKLELDLEKSKACIVKSDEKNDLLSLQIQREREVSKAAMLGMKSLADNIHENIALLHDVVHECGKEYTSVFPSFLLTNSFPSIVSYDDHKQSEDEVIEKEATNAIDDLVSNQNVEVSSVFKEVFNFISSEHKNNVQRATLLKSNTDTTERALMEAKLSSEKVSTLTVYLGEIEGELALKLDESESLKLKLEEQKSEFDTTRRDLEDQANRAEMSSLNTIHELRMLLGDSKNDVNDLRRALERKEADNHELQCFMNEEKKALASKENLIQKMENEILILKNRKSASEIECATEKENLSTELEKEIDRSKKLSLKANGLHKSLLKKGEELNDVMSECTILKESNEAEKKNSAKLMKRMTEVESNLRRQKKENDTLSRSNEELMKSKTILEREIATHRVRLSELVIDAAENLRVEDEKKVKERQQRVKFEIRSRKVLLPRGIMNKKGKKSHNESNLTAKLLSFLVVSAVASHRSNNRIVTDDTEKKVVELEADIKDLCLEHKRQVKSIRNEADQAILKLQNDLKSEMKRADDAEALQAKVDSKTQVFSNPMLLIESQQEKYFFEQESKNAKHQVASLKDQLEQKCSELQQNHIETSQFKSHTNKLLQDLRLSHSQKVDELMESLREKEETCLLLSRNCEASERQKMKLSTQIASLEAEHTKLTQKLQVYDSEIARLKEAEATHSLNEEMVRSEARMMVAKATHSLGDQNKNLQISIDTASNEINKMRNQIEAKDQLLKEYDEKTNSMRIELSQTASELKNTKQALHHMQENKKMVSELRDQCRDSRLELTREKLKFDVTSKKLQEYEVEAVAIQTILSDFVSRRQKADADSQAHYDEVAEVFDSSRISHVLSHALAGSERECESNKRKYLDQKTQYDSEREGLQKKISDLEQKIEDAKQGSLIEEEHVTSIESQLSATQYELRSMKERLQRRDQEINEMNHMLKAWEAMRTKKDLQISSLMEKCKEFERDRHSRTLLIHSLQRQITDSRSHYEPEGISTGI